MYWELFAVIAPSLWNILPLEQTLGNSIDAPIPTDIQSMSDAVLNYFVVVFLKTESLQQVGPSFK